MRQQYFSLDWRPWYHQTGEWPNDDNKSAAGAIRYAVQEISYCGYTKIAKIDFLEGGMFQTA